MEEKKNHFPGSSIGRRLSFFLVRLGGVKRQAIQTIFTRFRSKSARLRKIERSLIVGYLVFSSLLTQFWPDAEIPLFSRIVRYRRRWRRWRTTERRPVARLEFSFHPVLALVDRSSISPVLCLSARKISSLSGLCLPAS